MARYTVSDLNALVELAAATITPEQMEAFAQAAAIIGDAYTLRNRFLMWVQDPNVTTVAGFHAWKERGRKVRKGGRGIAILAPVTRKKKDKDTEQSEKPQPEPQAEGQPSDAPRKVVGVRVTYVFDRSQTEHIEACPECAASPGEECNPMTCTSDDRDEINTPAGPAPTAEEITALLAELTETEEEDAA